MNIFELYEKVPEERHNEIVVEGDHLYFDDEEYIINDITKELTLIRSHKKILQELDKLAK